MSGVTTELPRQLYRAEGVRALDRAAIETHGIGGAVLMERAGGATFAVLRQRWPQAGSIAVIAGTGNNGGDGFVVARLARRAGLAVEVRVVGDVQSVRGDARTHLQQLVAEGVRAQPWEQGAALRAEVVVDALLGTGLDRDAAGAHAAAIAAMNAGPAPVLAIDIPSGLHADTGQPLGGAVCAHATVTFIGLKQGLLTGAAPDHTGRLYFSDLDVPPQVYDAVSPSAWRIARAPLMHLLPRRRRTGHKGHFGHLLLIGGDTGYAGAIRLAGEAAARTGAGLVSLATRARHAASIAAQCPVLMSHGVETPAELEPLLARADAVAIGPGLGRSEWALGLLARVLEARQPLVADADALNLLAMEPCRRDDNWVLTPHPGEAARLLGGSVAGVQGDRYAAARELQSRYGGVCVLKGAGTIVCSAGELAACSAGNPGMGSGGVGDVLTGVIAALLAQGLGPRDAAQLGVCLHAEAGDRAAEGGERGLIATDLMPWLRVLVNG
ncbi:MAG: Bifunctional NAD(P)H-hydrate repair enzyme Nnr [Gammaproteobacteria bacterium]|nr:Bifunctional NAD(P)H-hydrate repair enzyme Nnr [Gammaproteobacteria bacterium]